ncbi:MAG: hypothetical protein PHG08_00970 [Bacilli bacterium]|nr:hypothetical protein [Bacilli bacterium]
MMGLARGGRKLKFVSGLPIILGGFKGNWMVRKIACFVAVKSNSYCHLVAPYSGAWIETIKLLLNLSHLTQVRGLKHKD